MFMHKQQMSENLSGLTGYMTQLSCYTTSPPLTLIHLKCPLISLPINLPPSFWSCHTFSLCRSPSNLVSWLVCLILLILTFVTTPLLHRLGSGPWNHHSPWGSGLLPDLAQTLIRANQHTSQQCPEVLLALQHPAASKRSCKQSIICLCLWIKCLCGGLSAYVGQCVFIRSVCVDGFWSGQHVTDTQLILPPTSHPESIN